MIEFVTEYIKKGKNDTLQEYLSNGGFQGLEAALSRSSLEVIEEIEKSGLCGRGGAYFPAGIKWQSLKDADCKESGEKYIVCNADEGEPGTFKDRYLLENCCWQVFEGMLIAAYATGAKKGYIYLRGEYRYLTLGTSLAVLREHQLLGNKIMDTDFSFEIEVRSGAGAYICGEESALLNSLQGERGVTRNKPPLPIRKGLWGQPTLIHNVETLATVVQIMKYGADFFREVGDSSALPGSKLVCFSGAFQNTGVYEVPMGIKLTDLIYRVCGGPKAEGDLKFIQIGGLTGRCVSCELLESTENLIYDKNVLKAYGISMGTGAIYGAPSHVDYLEFARIGAEFFLHESCGRCTPCREGIRQLNKELSRSKDRVHEKSVARIDRILTAMEVGSACGLGQGMPTFLRSILDLYHKNGRTANERDHN